ncbi:zinc ABC transporter substrate-binding protein [Alphaproteobacteria bacterium]|nr:zinc ABC transporter substrate-binding protein [Alphaproteobacteria bacterium]
MLKLLTIFSFMICFSFNLIASETKGVVTTIQPINSLVSAVIGNTGKTISLIPVEVSPHEYKLKPSDTKKLQNANIIFFVSDHLESSVTKVFENLPKNIKIINLMEDAGIKHLAIRDNEAWERHDHHHGHGDHDDHDKHAKKHNDHDHDKHEKKHDDHDQDKHEKKHDDHDHDKHEKKHDDHDHDKHEKKHDDHDHDKHVKKHDDHDDHEKEDDVHIWLSPDNAVKIIKKINKELSLYFPENAETYDKNANQMIKEINQLKVELKKELSGIKDKPYIVFHDAYQYFETSFGLNAAGSVALEGDIASSPKQISIIKDKIVKLKASCVFQEPQFDSKLVKIVVEGTNAQIGTLDPLGVNIKSGENFYLQLLKNMAKSLKDCLG